MVKAIEKGIPKMRIEESAAKRQAKVDSGEETIVGVNKYKPNQEQDINILSIDNDQARRDQIRRLEEIKKRRNNENVKMLLSKLRDSGKK